MTVLVGYREKERERVGYREKRAREGEREREGYGEKRERKGKRVSYC